MSRDEGLRGRGRHPAAERAMSVRIGALWRIGRKGVSARPKKPETRIRLSPTKERSESRFCYTSFERG